MASGYSWVGTVQSKNEGKLVYQGVLYDHSYPPPPKKKHKKNKMFGKIKIRLKLVQPSAFFWGIKNHWAGHGQNQNSDLQLFLLSVQKWSLLTVQAEPSPSAHRNNQFYTQFPPQYYWQMHCSHPFPALIVLRCHSSPNISLALLSPRTNTLKHAESVRTGTRSLTHHI